MLCICYLKIIKPIKTYIKVKVTVTRVNTNSPKNSTIIGSLTFENGNVPTLII